MLFFLHKLSRYRGDVLAEHFSLFDADIFAIMDVHTFVCLADDGYIVDFHALRANEGRGCSGYRI